MKATDLMIGDWVYNTHNRQNEQVEQIGCHINLYDCDEIEPIPLTPEILIKNGFQFDEEETNSDIQSVYKDYTEFYKFPLGKGFYIEYNTVTKTFWITDHCWIEFKYVHEFQHVLKMCDIKKEIEL